MERSSRNWRSTCETPFDQLSDPGIYYVYEKGQLRSPPGYGRSNKYHMSSRLLDTNSTSLSTVCCFTVSSIGPDGNQTYHPRKLLDISVEFVAKHVEYVDSLEGFPELIGQQLFGAVVKHGRLKELNCQSLKILTVFSKAYNNLILDRLMFKSYGLKLESFVEAIEVCFSQLTVLDLHGCRIGDAHEMIELIGKLNSLKQLGLCHNALSDHGIQKMTAPMRMFQRGPLHLEILDLSCNPQITAGSVRYILAYKNICSLDLSGTSVKVQGLKKLEDNSTLKLVHTGSSSTMPNVFDVHENAGWASDVVHSWLSNKEEKNVLKEQSQTKQFYSRKKIRQELAADLRKRTEKHENTPARKPVLIFKSNKDAKRLAGSKQMSRTIDSSHSLFDLCDSTSNNSISNMSDINEITSWETQYVRDSSTKSKSDKKNVLSPKSQSAKKTTKKKVTLSSAIEMLTEEPKCKAPLSEENNAAQKRRISSGSENELPSNKKRHYSIEEQHLIGQYFAPCTPSRSGGGSLMQAMGSPEWTK